MDLILTPVLRSVFTVNFEQTFFGLLGIYDLLICLT